MIKPRARAPRSSADVLPPDWQPVLPRVFLESGKLKDSVLNELTHVLGALSGLVAGGWSIAARTAGRCLAQADLGASA